MACRKRKPASPPISFDNKRTRMKIAIIGYSGCGKSTLAEKLSQKYQLPALYLDTVHHLPGWQARPREETRAIVGTFLDEHDATGWVIDGNYKRQHFQRRMEEADSILLLRFHRLACLYRAWKRYQAFRGKSRPSMTAGCEEKLDREFIRWILWEGPKSHTPLFDRVQAQYPEKVTVIRNQRQLDAYYREQGL